MLPDVIYAASIKYVSNFIAPSGSSWDILMTSDAPDTDHILIREKTGHTMEKLEH